FKTIYGGAIMKTSEQIKGAIRNISKKTGINPNSLLQMCLFEGILEKLSKSKYSENFILKGGLLISSLIGVDMRSTMDMDTTLRGIPLNEVSITKILNEILAIEIDADIEYKLIKLSPIRQEDVYEDFCASISCIFGKINATLNIDITTGDVITPREMNYSYSKILEEGTIPIMTYTIETILAEKFETISSRNITTTRARDFYDLYMIYSIYKDKIDKGILRKAIERTSKYRGSFETALQYKEIVELFRESETPKKLWKKYTQNNPYAKDVDFLDTISVYEEIGTVLNVNDDTK
ncbi:nucleotidyl transferase AbiEii/AbiGii toxin family protein, partial [Streptococcus pyogenes]